MQWEPQRANPEHAHDFTAHVMIVEGEFTLTTPTGAPCYRAGEKFSLQAGTLHQERAGWCTHPGWTALSVARR